MVKQILVNLISNAVKFSDSGSTVQVTCRQEDGHVAISVDDQGIGIKEQDIPMALAPFGQVDGALSKRHDGSGLGLPLSKALAESNHGSLTVTSKPGVGTNVTVRFPNIT
jgi:signal transduction histidine kinase